MEKSYKIQQRNWVGGVKKKAIFADFWWLGQKMCPKIFPTDFIFEMSGWIQATKYYCLPPDMNEHGYEEPVRRTYYFEILFGIYFIFYVVHI